MTRKISLAWFAAPAIALMTLAGCAAPFQANVARFQRLPDAQGQTFTVVADDPRLAGGLEFGQYAGLVAQHLNQVGYTQATDPATANLVVHIRYDVDNGQEKIRSNGFGYDPFYRGWGPYWGGGWGWRGRYYSGFYDPWLFGPGGGYNDISSYTVYTSKLEMRIDRMVDGVRLFEGTATARSLSNKLTYLVPNLVDAMFTGFPGSSGEDVKITLPPEKKG